MKLIVETGSESHTTSSASVQAKFVGGSFDGQHLYQQKQLQVRADWTQIGGGKHGRWVLAEFNLPEGTQIAVIGKGRTGARGADKHEFHRIYRLDSAADVLEQVVDVGLRGCTLKGRLVLVRDLVAERKPVDTEEGF